MSQSVLGFVVTSLLAAACVAWSQECAPPANAGVLQESWAITVAADASLGGGSDSFVGTTNISIFLFNGDVTARRNLGDFWWDGGIGIIGDPVIRFDSDSQRYFTVAHNGNVALAVSKTSAPSLDSADWHFFDFDYGGNDHYQNVSPGRSHVFFSTLVNGADPRPRIGYCLKSDVLDGPPADLTMIQLPSFQTRQHKVGCVTDHDRVSDTGYFVADSHLTGSLNNFIRMYAIVPGDTPQIVGIDMTVPDYPTAPDTVLTPSTPYAINPDMKTSVLRNGRLWTVHTIGVEQSQYESKLRWYEIDLNGWPESGNSPFVVQSGTIDPGPGVSASYAAIHVDNVGNVALAWNQSSATEHVSIYRAIRKHYDPSGTFRAPLLLKAGTGEPPGSFRSDYASIDEDPSDPGVFWSHHMYYEDDRSAWLGRIDVNQSLTLSITPATGPLPRGTQVTLETRGAAPGGLVRWYYSFTDCGSSYIEPLNATLAIDQAVYIAQDVPDSEGTAIKNFTIPLDFATGEVWIQAAELENTSEVLKRVIE